MLARGAASASEQTLGANAKKNRVWSIAPNGASFHFADVSRGLLAKPRCTPG
jgi:hypothetical protein